MPACERPAILVLMVEKRTFHTAVVDLLAVAEWQAKGYVIVVRDPFTMDAWNLWRSFNPEAS